MFLHDATVGEGDIFEAGILVGIQNQGVIQAAGPLENGSASAAAAQHRDIFGPAAGQVQFLFRAIAVPENREGVERLPNAENFLVAFFLGPIEQGLVEGEVLLRGWQRQLEVIHVVKAIL
jgi:hypothetical protein